LKVLDL